MSLDKQKVKRFQSLRTNRYETYYSQFIRIDTTNDIRFGHDMFSDEYTGFVVLRDGSFITDKYAYKNNTFYDRITGEIVDLPKRSSSTH